MLAEADDGPELEEEDAAAAAELDANEEPAVGGCGSGVILVKSVSQPAPLPIPGLNGALNDVATAGLSPKLPGLKLLSRSPSPSNRAWRVNRRALARWFEARLRA